MIRHSESSLILSITTGTYGIYIYPINTKLRNLQTISKIRLRTIRLRLKSKKLSLLYKKKYIKYLHNIVVNPANRRNNAYIKLKTLTQTDNQSVKDLRYTIKLLKKDIPKQNKKLEAQSFFTAFHPGLQKEVLRELHSNITTRQEIITVTQRYKEQFRGQKKSTTTTPTKNIDYLNKNSSKNTSHQDSEKNNTKKSQ